MRHFLMRRFEKIGIPRTFTQMFVETGIFMVGGFFFVTGCIVLMLLNTTVQLTPEPLKYEVVEFSSCSGLNDFGLQKEKQIFHPNEPIFTCGYLDINQPSILITIYWNHEGQDIHRDVI